MSAASATGGRHHQEDRAVQEWIESPTGSGWLLAVFDGHRGAASAEKAAQSLPALVRKCLEEHKGNAARALEDVFRALHDLTQGDVSGSTASVALIPENAKTVTVAILGDSPVAVLDARGRAHYGPDHNVRTNREERAAAEARGGIYRAGYLEDAKSPGIGLQMARALGDADLDRVLERAPEIDAIPMGGNGVVLVGTDGLLSPGGGTNADQLNRLLRLIQDGADAKDVVADALARATDDNVTAIIWKGS